MSARTDAARHAGGPGYAQTMATIYVGDQLSRIADALEKRGPRTPPYYEAIEAPTLEDDPNEPHYVPGRLVT